MAWHHARPPQEQATDAHRRSLAQALYHAERWEEARALLAGLAASHPEDVTVQGQLGVVAARQDRPADARRIAAWLATVDQPYTWAAPVGWRAAIAAQLGEPEAALTLLRESVTRGRLREGFHSDPALEPLRRLPAFRALLRPQG